jgi:hypothetical protein
MKKEKWQKVFRESQDKVNDLDDLDFLEIGPQHWPFIREKLTNFVKEIDEVTEVYNLENKGEENG